MLVSLTKGKVDASTASLPVEKPKASVIYAGLQRRLRQHMKTAEQVSSLLANESKGVTHYGVPMTRVIESLAFAGLPLDAYEIEYIRGRFANPREEVNFQEVLTSHNVGRPEDFVEPDLLRDPLPQPFRMINELFEQEILDRAWIEILQRHPDISIDSRGRPIVVPRNKNLNLCAAPTVINDGKATKIVAIKTPGVGVFSFGLSSSGTLITMY